MVKLLSSSSHPGRKIRMKSRNNRDAGFFIRTPPFRMGVRGRKNWRRGGGSPPQPLDWKNKDSRFGELPHGQAFIYHTRSANNMNRLVLETGKNLLEAEDLWCQGKEIGHKRPLAIRRQRRYDEEVKGNRWEAGKFPMLRPRLHRIAGDNEVNP